MLESVPASSVWDAAIGNRMFVGAAASPMAAFTPSAVRASAASLVAALAAIPGDYVVAAAGRCPTSPAKGTSTPVNLTAQRSPAADALPPSIKKIPRSPHSRLNLASDSHVIAPPRR